MNWVFSGCLFSGNLLEIVKAPMCNAHKNKRFCSFYHKRCIIISANFRNECKTDTNFLNENSWSRIITTVIKWILFAFIKYLIQSQPLIDRNVPVDSRRRNVKTDFLKVIFKRRSWTNISTIGVADLQQYSQATLRECEKTGKFEMFWKHYRGYWRRDTQKGVDGILNIFTELARETRREPL